MKRTLLGLAAFLLIVSSMAFQPSAPASAQESTGSQGICSSNPDAPLDIVLTLDRSGSINDQGVDPSGKRFEATDSFIDGLVDVADSGKEIAINVVFFNTEAQASGWQDLTGTSADGIKQSIQSGWENPTGETDHVKAFEESYDAFESRPDRCRIVVMFTDGVMDTGPGNVESDVERALGQSQPCTQTNGSTVVGSDDAGDTLSQKANDLGVATFVLLLHPASGAEGFHDRLNATMTLFSAVTGDTEPQDVGTDYKLQCTTDLEGQSGEILSADDVNRMLAQFYAIGDELGGGEQVVTKCPAPFAGGTESLPAGALIDRLTIIDFDADSGTDSARPLDDFTILTADGATFSASIALEGDTTNPVRWTLNVSDPDVLSAGWRLQSPKEGSYCVSLFEHTDLAATLSTESGTIRLQEDGGLETLDIAYEPEAVNGQIALTVDFDGATATTENDRIDVKIPVAWAEDAEPPGNGIPPATGTARALDTEFFQEMPVTITVEPVQILDRTSGEYPKISCEASSLTLLEGDAPKSGAIDATNTGCVVKPGISTGGERTFLTLSSVIDATNLEGDDSTATVRFTLSPETNATELAVGTPLEITEETEIWVSVDGIENERTIIEDVATFTVSYERTDGAVEEAGSDSIEISVDLKARANRLVATLATILLMLLFGLASMLLLWLFNRLTARLPDGSKFYYQDFNGDQGSSSDQGNGNSRDMKPARSSHGILQFGDIQIQLDHPPVWKPLSDSVGVINAQWPAVADPTGPALGTVPLGFSNLLIAARRASGGADLTAVVPRSGPRSGIDGVRAMSNDTSRRHRVAERLERHDPPDTDAPPAGENGEPQAANATSDPKTPHGAGDSDTGATDTLPPAPKPKPKGPRLPGSP